MRTALLFLYVTGFVIANVCSVIQFKFAADAVGRTALRHFVLGSLIGVIGPAALTLALKHGNPNIIYALCFGSAFAVLQIVSWHLFQESLSNIQWAGIACVAVGILLIHVRAA